MSKDQSEINEYEEGTDLLHYFEDDDDDLDAMDKFLAKSDKTLDDNAY